MFLLCLLHHTIPAIFVPKVFVVLFFLVLFWRMQTEFYKMNSFTRELLIRADFHVVPFDQYKVRSMPWSVIHGVHGFRHNKHGKTLHNTTVLLTASAGYPIQIMKGNVRIASINNSKRLVIYL